VYAENFHPGLKDRILLNYRDERTQARNQLGTPGSKEFSESGPGFLNYAQYFQIMSNIFFQGERKIF